MEFKYQEAGLLPESRASVSSAGKQHLGNKLASEMQTCPLVHQTSEISWSELKQLSTMRWKCGTWRYCRAVIKSVHLSAAEDLLCRQRWACGVFSFSFYLKSPQRYQSFLLSVLTEEISMQTFTSGKIHYLLPLLVSMVKDGWKPSQGK